MIDLNVNSYSVITFLKFIILRTAYLPIAILDINIHYQVQNRSLVLLILETVSKTIFKSASA